MGDHRRCRRRVACRAGLAAVVLSLLGVACDEGPDELDGAYADEEEPLDDLPDGKFDMPGLQDVPEFLLRTEDEAPIPTWEQVTRVAFASDGRMLEAVTRLLGGTEDEARARFEALQPRQRRSFGSIVDKITNEGWLDQVGLVTTVWDDTILFELRDADAGVVPLATALRSKPGYTRNTAANGLAAYFNSWNHSAWIDGFMENDTGHAALHVGIFGDGTGEAHLEVYNALFTEGAPFGQAVWVPAVGWINSWHFVRHQWWEGPTHGPATRRSANFYFLLADANVPLSF